MSPLCNFQLGFRENTVRPTFGNSKNPAVENLGFAINVENIKRQNSNTENWRFILR